MENRKKRKVLLGLIIFTTLLLIGTIAFSLIRDQDSYRYFTGMGSSFDLSPDEQHYIFSYYLDGQENIYTAKVDGTEVTKLTESPSARHHSPKYSTDGNKILFLSKDEEGINTLYLANLDGKKQKSLTSAQMHVSDAVFSKTDDAIYYIATPAEDFKKAEGETQEGFDLFVVDLTEEKSAQLTDRDYFTMEGLSLSQDGTEIYYSLFDGNREKITSYSLEGGSEKAAPGSNRLPVDSYYFSYSPDGSKIAFTTISEESRDSSLYKYELFLLDTDKDEINRLTNLESSVVQPLFFNDQNQIAFLENTNWPTDPADHHLKVIDTETEEIESITFDIPNPNSGHWAMKTIDLFANGYTVAFLYTVLIGLIITFLSLKQSRRKTYLPAIISLILASLVLISSFVVAGVYDPWTGIGLGMIAIVLFGCTLILFGYAFVLNLFRRKQ